MEPGEAAFENLGQLGDHAVRGHVFALVYRLATIQRSKDRGLVIVLHPASNYSGRVQRVLVGVGGRRHRGRGVHITTRIGLLGIALVSAISAPAEAHTLHYSTAKRAAQKRADRFAHQRTRVASLTQLSRHRYLAQARWTHVDPIGCKGCGYDPNTNETYDTPSTEYCSVTMRVAFRSRRSHRVVTRITDSSCF